MIALRQIACFKDRAREDPRQVMVYRNAADIVEALSDAQRERLGASNGWQSLLALSPNLARTAFGSAGSLDGGEMRAALQGDLHVHSKLAMDSEAMTRRMVKAVSNPHTDVLGHCTGRLVTGGRGMRPESKFDAEKVFTACLEHGTAVEINSRPERRDPPTRLLTMALEIGCVFSIDTDAHAPGQLDFLGYGAQRALDAEVPIERIVNTWPADELLEWASGG